MTDARFPDRWLTDRRLLRLPDDAFRLFAVSLMWSVANKTDGVLYDDDLTLIPRADTGCVGQLESAGLWARGDGRWVITVFADSQTSRTELDALAARRLADRKRKARERLNKAAGPAVPGDNPGAQSRDASRDSHAESVRLGQDRLTPVPVTSLKGQNQGQEQDAGPIRVGNPISDKEGLTSMRSAAKSQNPRLHHGLFNGGPGDQQNSDPELTEPSHPAVTRASRRPATVQRQQERKNRILALVASTPECTGNSIQAAIGGNRQVMLDALNDLIEEGKVKRVADPADRRVIRYAAANGAAP